MEETQKYKYSSKNEYSEINRGIISKLQEEKESQQSITYYTINVEYYDEYDMHYLTIPKEYLNQIDDLRKKKEDIFARGKILTFSDEKNDFTFDAIIDSTEDIYAYLVPIKEKYRNDYDLTGEYVVNERIGDLTYIRMKEAIREFIKGNCCSKNLEKYILGEADSNLNNIELKNIFNYNRYYMAGITNFAELSNFQETQMKNIFYNEMNTIQLKSKSNKKLICLIIYAIYQIRKNPKDKILVCSSSNNAADAISLELLKMKNNVSKFNILRIYAKNQEIIKRNKKLNKISFHKLKNKKYDKKFYDRNDKKDWIIRNHDIIISTCVNSYNDDIINYKFPFVIIIDANNSNEHENLIPITLHAKHVVLISYEGSDNGEINLYKRMENLYPKNHITI